jgi:hypothetical protein
MAKGQRLKPEQIVTLLRQIDVLTTNGKTLECPNHKENSPTSGLLRFLVARGGTDYSLVN